MEWNPRLQKQRSCAAVDVGYWCRSLRRTGSFRRSTYSNNSINDNADGHVEEEFESLNCRAAAPPRWQVLWRRIVKEKRRIVKEKKRIFPSSVAQFQVPYDPYTYSQNFDHGSACLEPENLSRSFSARFADSSRMLRLQRVG
ncbi:hypothetical protein H6P81_003785 [Aristolochia fimbriata]|uniref:Uncharacterized protein n=1 Tax=Aristolochia fimbriata TaxID=158543 RepID=A0AAV7FDK2_ARIFI|nr:hypothetical protein H6P81_003785 [Aristolochia fimbriata]